jgi:hypothetical protein
MAGTESAGIRRIAPEAANAKLDFREALMICFYEKKTPIPALLAAAKKFLQPHLPPSPPRAAIPSLSLSFILANSKS